MIGYIYIYTNTVNNKVYIGLTTDISNRKSSHKYKAENTKENSKFYNAIRKYGWKSFTFKVLIKIEATSLKDLTIFLDALEVFYIWKYDSFKHGYNSTAGGHCYRGKTISEKFREYCKNRIYTEETRKKMSEAAKRRIVSEETRKKCRENALKRNFSSYRELTTEKRNLGIRKTKAKAVLQIDVTTRSVIREWEAIIDAAKYLSGYSEKTVVVKNIANNIVKCCKGKLEGKYKGFIWKYKPIV